MNLTDKVSILECEAAVAARVAAFWRKQIAEHGEVKTEAFYKTLHPHNGNGHEKKSITWEGLTLRREPTEAEKLCIKSVSSAQDAGKESIRDVLLKLRPELIEQGIKKLKKLGPADYHTLIIEVSTDAREDLKTEVAKVYKKGRATVATQLRQSKRDENDPEDFDDFEDIDELVDLTDARLANEIQSRITGAASRFKLLGRDGKGFYDSVRDEVENGSTGYIDRAATGLANKVVNIGRTDEAQARSDEWEKVQYSAILDQNTCNPCSAADGEESTDEADLEPVPNASCDGSDYCRCFWVYIAPGG